jgi:hypothetical protein
MEIIFHTIDTGLVNTQASEGVMCEEILHKGPLSSEVEAITHTPDRDHVNATNEPCMA